MYPFKVYPPSRIHHLAVTWSVVRTKRPPGESIRRKFQSRAVFAELRRLTVTGPYTDDWFHLLTRNAHNRLLSLALDVSHFSNSRRSYRFPSLRSLRVSKFHAHVDIRHSAVVVFVLHHFPDPAVLRRLHLNLNTTDFLDMWDFPEVDLMNEWIAALRPMQGLEWVRGLEPSLIPALLGEGPFPHLRTLHIHSCPAAHIHSVNFQPLPVLKSLKELRLGYWPLEEVGQPPQILDSRGVTVFAQQHQLEKLIFVSHDLDLLHCVGSCLPNFGAAFANLRCLRLNLSPCAAYHLGPSLINLTCLQFLQIFAPYHIGCDDLTQPHLELSLSSPVKSLEIHAGGPDYGLKLTLTSSASHTLRLLAWHELTSPAKPRPFILNTEPLHQSLLFRSGQIKFQRIE